MTSREGLQRHAPATELSVAAPVIKFPLAIEENTNFLTPADKLFVLAHLGIPRVTADSWSCQLAGMIGSPMLLRYEDLSRFTQKTVKTYFQCAGNPLEPTLAARQIANLEWHGALLREVLEEADVSAKGKFLWAFGSDHGEFFGSPHQGCKLNAKRWQRCSGPTSGRPNSGTASTGLKNGSGCPV
ncbi:MAG: molybdopterin-dependent oxidoreductase [Pseudomonadota bacterium]